MESVYRLDGSRVLTGPMAGGPWDVNLQHGSAPSALVVAIAEQVPTAVPMRIARLTVDLMRPLPVAALEVKTEILREGRKIQLCGIDLLANGKLAVRGMVLKVRRESLALPDTAENPHVTLPPAEAGHPAQGKITDNPFMGCLSMRVVKGAFNKPGPAAVWFRLERPMIEGQANSPAMRAVVAADFCNGVSSVLDFRSWTFVNGDLSVNLAAGPGRRLGAAGRRDVARTRRQRHRLWKTRRFPRLFRPGGAEHPDRAARGLEHGPEKWEPVCAARPSGSEKTILKQKDERRV